MLIILMLKKKCGGTPQLVASINYTIIPNLFVFGSLILILMLMPGWKGSIFKYTRLFDCMVIGCK